MLNELTKSKADNLSSSLVQSVERRTVNPYVAGSSPAGGAIKSFLTPPLLITIIFYTVPYILTVFVITVFAYLFLHFIFYV